MHIIWKEPWIHLTAKFLICDLGTLSMMYMQEKDALRVHGILFEPLVDDDDQDEDREGLSDGDELRETQVGMPDKEDLP
jgi:hypothetical protein